MKKMAVILIAALMCAMLPFAAPASAAPEMSDVPNMTAPGVLPVVSETVKLTIGIPPQSTVTDFDDNYFTHYIEKLTGVDVEFYFFPAENPEQKLELMVSAGQELPDIISVFTLSTLSRNNFYQMGVILPLDDMMDKYAFYWNDMADTYLSDKDKSNMEIFTRSYDGARICFPSLYSDPSNNYQNINYINKTWLDALELQVPKTTGELRDVLKAFKEKDPNGNGQQDEIPMFCAEGGIRTLLTAFIYPEMFNSHDGVLSTPYTSEEYKNGLKFVRSLVEEGLLSPLSFTVKETAQQKSMLELDGTDTQPYIGAFSGHPTRLFNADSATFMNYAALEPLTGSDGACFAIYNPTYTERYATSITRYCETPEIALRFLDTFAEPDTMLSSRWGEKDVDWRYVEASENQPCRYEVFGYDTIYQWNNNPYASANNLIWKTDWITCLPAKLMGSQVMPNFANEQARYKSSEYMKGMAACIGKEPAEVVGTLMYTEEETMKIAEISATIQSYINECQTRFVMGEMSLDGDWDAYVTSLNDMGLNTLIEVSQEAWERMTR